MGWGSLRGLVLAGYGGLGMVNMNVGWLIDGWMDGWIDGWIDDSPATPHRALGPARSMYHRTFRALDLPFLFFVSFSPDHEPDPLSSPFFQSASFPACISPGSSCFFKPLFWISEVLQHALFVYFLIPLRVRIRRWPWMLV